MKGQLQDYDDILYDEALDKTDTVATEGITDSESDSDGEWEPSFNIEQISRTTEQQEMQELKGVADELLRVHGVAPGKKSEGTTRLIMENPNGFNTIIKNNVKLEKARELNDELEADIVVYPEHRINCRHKENKNGMSQMFRGGEADIRAVVGHNVHENVSKAQEGVVASLLFGPLIEQYNFEESGKDNTGLGRWVVMTFQGQDDIVT